MKQFVAAKDVDNATVYVCSGSDHPALYAETFFTGTPHWIDSAPPDLTDRQRGRILVKWRYFVRLTK
jgi:tRNA U34 2-thiouridine synthase MnmA/TrmU